MYKKIPLLCIVFLALCCKKNKPIPVIDERPAIEALMHTYRDNWIKRDTTKILDCLTEDFVYFRPELDKKPIYGKRAVSEFFFQKGNYPFAVISYNASNSYVHFDNNLAFCQGVSRYFWCLEKNGVKTDTILSVYDFTNILVKIDGVWKLQSLTHIYKEKDYYR